MVAGDDRRRVSKSASPLMDFLDGIGKAGDALKMGGPWGLLALALLVIWHQQGKLDIVHAALVAAWKEIGDLVNDSTKASTDWTSANEARTRALEASVRSQELSAAVQQQVSVTIQSLTAELRDTKQELQRTHEALLRALLQKGAAA